MDIWEKLYKAAEKECNKDMEIMLDYENRETVTLSDLTPNWWGWERYEKEN